MLLLTLLLSSLTLKAQDSVAPAQAIPLVTSCRGKEEGASVRLEIFYDFETSDDTNPTRQKAVDTRNKKIQIALPGESKKKVIEPPPVDNIYITVYESAPLYSRTLLITSKNLVVVTKKPLLVKSRLTTPDFQIDMTNEKSEFSGLYTINNSELDQEIPIQCDYRR